MSDSITWFRRELKIIGMDANADLRAVRDRGRLGVDLWVVERKLPEATHQDCIEYLRSQGVERFVDQVLTDENGSELGRRQMDLAPEWAVVHICRVSDIAGEKIDHDDPRSYREPNAQDLMSIRRWLFEFKNVAEQMRTWRREFAEREAAKKKDATLSFDKDLKSSHLFRQLEFKDASKIIMPGTEVQSDPAKFNIEVVPS